MRLVLDLALSDGRKLALENRDGPWDRQSPVRMEDSRPVANSEQ